VEPRRGGALGVSAHGVAFLGVLCGVVRLLRGGPDPERRLGDLHAQPLAGLTGGDRSTSNVQPPSAVTHQHVRLAIRQGAAHRRGGRLDHGSRRCRTGWAGQTIAEARIEASDLELTSAVSRSAASRDLGKAWGAEPNGVPVFGAVTEGLDGVDLVVDYTSHDAVRAYSLAAIERGVAVVIGSSGLAASDFADLDAAAREACVGVVAAGNYSLTAAMAQTAALRAARHVPSWEIISYASATKPDAPSGTARELAERLAQIQPPVGDVPVNETSWRVLHTPMRAPPASTSSRDGSGPRRQQGGHPAQTSDPLRDRRVSPPGHDQEVGMIAGEAAAMDRCSVSEQACRTKSSGDTLLGRGYLGDVARVQLAQ
jgi:dihydrodipicolinate reductase